MRTEKNPGRQLQTAESKVECADYPTNKEREKHSSVNWKKIDSEF